jgi:putative ABC transport system substrate-binding protein
MRRLADILVLAIALVLCASSSNAQQPGKVFRVGILALPPANTMQQRLGVFREALRDLGYEEGRNLIVESRFADGVYDRLPVLAGELARLKVDVFLTPGEPVLLAAKEKGENIPIVAVTCDPLEKLLGSLRRPGGNATGFSCVSADLVGKRFSLLKSLLPRMERVAVFYNKRDNHELEFKDADAVAQSLGIGLVHFPVGSPADFEPAFKRIIEEKCDALYIVASTFAQRALGEACSACARLPAASDVRLPRIRILRWPHILRSQSVRRLATRGSLRRQDSQGIAAIGLAGGATDSL